MTGSGSGEIQDDGDDEAADPGAHERKDQQQPEEQPDAPALLPFDLEQGAPRRLFHP